MGSGRYQRPTAIERFEAKVDRSMGIDACHPWHGTIDKKTGYGLFWFEGRNVLAHRFAFTFDGEPIPDGKQVRHSCDNSPCVNKAHLLTGTQADNMQDRIMHGAGYARGVLHPRARLTEDLIQRAAELRRKRQSWYQIATTLGVERSTIARAVQHQGGLWAHVDVGKVPRHIITNELLQQALASHDEGQSWRAIERELGVRRQSLAYALRTRGSGLRR
jgi:hypothetical protein